MNSDFVSTVHTRAHAHIHDSVECFRKTLPAFRVCSSCVCVCKSVCVPDAYDAPGEQRHTMNTFIDTFAAAAAIRG